MKSYLPLMMASAIMLSSASACGKPSTASGTDDRWTWNGQENGSESQNAGDPFYPKAEGSFRIMTYNVGVFSKYMTNSTEMVASMINEIEPDVVGLNELDSINTRHHTYQLAALASTLGGWNYYFGRAMAYKEGAYGNGVVVPAKTKINSCYTVILPKGTGSEQRSIAVIETDRFVLGAAHLDHTTEDSVLGQIEVVNEWARERYKDYEKPVFFCGDMNTTQYQPAFTEILSCWDMISNGENSAGGVSAPTRCIDFIFHYRESAAVKVVESHTMTKFYNGDVTKASDHLPVYVDVSF